MFKLEDKWVWDFWLAQRLGEYHIFYLQAPRSLGDERLRHRSATIGHAISTDLENWTVLPDALQPGPPGSWDDLATWTGSIIEKDGRWYLFYTGISTAEDGLVQRIGVALSDDLTAWHKSDANPTITADPRWYELLDEADWHNQAWRDPWVYQDRRTGLYHALITARRRHGAPWSRGVVGRATSTDLLDWTVQPPVAEPEVSGDIEVPQYVEIGSSSYIVFCSHRWDEETKDGIAGPTIAYLVADDPDGPFTWHRENVLSPGSLGWYAGKVTQRGDGSLHMLAWRMFEEDGEFGGYISDPIPMRQVGNKLSLPAGSKTPHALS
jgi:beta-fructofuranosidase